MALVLVCFLAVLAALMFLQPSSQESALDALSAVEKVVDQVKGPDAPAKLDLARQMLTDLKVTKASQSVWQRFVEIRLSAFYANVAC